MRCAVAEIHREQLLAQPFQAQDLLAQKGFPQTAQKSISVTNDCVLTGYCADMDILKPIYDFLKVPDKHTNLYDLMNDCIDSFFRFCRDDVEYTSNEEAFERDCEANGYEFLSNGDFFN